MLEVTSRAEDTTTIGWEDTTTISVEHRAVDLTLKSLDTAWLFELGAYYWSTQNITIDGQAYSAKVDPASFSGITIARAYNGAERIHVLEDITIEIPDSADTYTSSNFLDLDVDIYAYANDGTYAGAIRKFLFVVIGAKKVYNILYLTLRDRFAHDELEALYPTSEMVQDVWASDGDSKLGYCMPIPFGAAFIPMPSIYITDQRYYLLGEPDGTYTIKKVQSPQDWPKSVWESGGYTFTQYTKDTYRVFQAIIADSDADGIADANGLFPDGSKFEPISVEYTRSDTATITNPANIIANLIFSGSGVTIDLAFYRNDTTFEGAFTHPRPRYEWASEILKACNAAMVIGANGHRQIKNLVPTAYGQLTTANILSDSFNFDPIVSSDNYDGGYVQFPKAGDPQHVLYKYKVGLGNNASVNPSPDTLNLQFVDDTQEAQKFGILYFERLVDKSADVQAEAWLDMMELNPDAVLGISGALYDSAVNADMVIDSLSISADMTVSIKGEQFDHSLSIFGDLEPPALSIAVDDSTGTWTPIIVGPGGTDSQGNNLNALTKHLQIASGGTIKVGTLPSIDGGLLIDDTHIAGYSTTGTKTLELIYAGTNQGDAYFGDYDSGNAGIKYDHDTGLFLRINEKEGINFGEGASIVFEASSSSAPDPSVIIFELDTDISPITMNLGADPGFWDADTFCIWNEPTDSDASIYIGVNPTLNPNEYQFNYSHLYSFRVYANHSELGAINSAYFPGAHAAWVEAHATSTATHILLQTYTSDSGGYIELDADDGIHIREQGLASSALPGKVILYAIDQGGISELVVKDEAGNATTLSPHAFELFEPKDTYDFPWSYYSENEFIGKIINVDMYGAIREIEKLSGKKFIYLKDIPKKDWDDYFDEKVAMENEIQKDRKNKKYNLVEKKEMPKWLKNCLNRSIYAKNRRAENN